MQTIYDERAAIFKALSDAHRLKILELLQSGEKCTCTLTAETSMPQSTLSYHMKILCESGIVTGREEGKWTYYRISKSGSSHAVELLRQLTTAQEKTIPCGCCSE